MDFQRKVNVTECVLTHYHPPVVLQVFFTRNGKLMGRREMAVPPGGFFPTLGMLSSGEKVKVDLQPLSGWSESVDWASCTHIIWDTKQRGRTQNSSATHMLTPLPWLAWILIVFLASLYICAKYSCQIQNSILPMPSLLDFRTVRAEPGHHLCQVTAWC